MVPIATIPPDVPGDRGHYFCPLCRPYPMTPAEPLAIPAGSLNSGADPLGSLTVKRQATALSRAAGSRTGARKVPAVDDLPLHGTLPPQSEAKRWPGDTEGLDLCPKAVCTRMIRRGRAAELERTTTSREPDRRTVVRRRQSRKLASASQQPLRDGSYPPAARPRKRSRRVESLVPLFARNIGIAESVHFIMILSQTSHAAEPVSCAGLSDIS
jgi:hypothetical protein